YENGGAAPRGSDFVEIVRKLAARAGVDASVLDRGWTAEDQERLETRDRRSALLESFLGLAGVALRGQAGTAARAYLVGRGFQDDELGDLGFGLFPSSQDDVRRELVARRYSVEEVEASGLLLDGRWTGRVVFPWRDRSGAVGSIVARDISEKAEAGSKYL